MPVDAQSLSEQSSCFLCYGATGVEALELALLASIAGINPIVTDWVQQIIDNGGNRPSDPTITAVNDFVNDLDEAGLTPLMIAVNIFAPDNLTAARTPIISTAGNNPWTNANFVAQDLSPFGLLGNGTSKSLDTGINAAAVFGITDSGITVFVNAPSNGFVECDAGCNEVALPIFTIHSDADGNTVADSFNATLHRINVVNNMWQGYTSANRVNASDFRVYTASPTTPHAQLASDLTLNTLPPPATNIFCHARNNNGVAAGWTRKRLGFCAIHHGLTQAQSLALYNAVLTLRTAFAANTGARNPIVNDWANRVVANGGAAPSAATLNALNTFCNTLDAQGLTPLMMDVCPFVPDNLIAAITPLIRSHGLDPWTNSNFVLADLTVNGLIGNGTTKRLDVGFNPETIFRSTAAVALTGGLTVYNMTAANAAGQEIGALTSGNGSALQMHVSHSAVGGNALCDCFNDTTMRINAANALWTGYLSTNRTALNAYSLYRANSVTPHASIGSVVGNNTLGGPNTDVSCFSGNNAGVPFAFSAKRLSFAAIHRGLTATQSSNFFNAIQTLRTALGGGFI